MTRRDLALIVLAAALGLTVAVAATVLCGMGKVEGETAVASYAPIVAIAGAAIGRLSGGPSQDPEPFTPDEAL